MKSLIKNYIDLLSIEKIEQFALKNNINLTNYELEFLLNLVKTNYENIIKNDEKYLKEIENNISSPESKKIIELYVKYKKKYKGYLF